MPLTKDMENAVLTRSTHSTPSDGAGRLERPIMVREIMKFSDINVTKWRNLKTWQIWEKDYLSQV